MDDNEGYCYICNSYGHLESHHIIPISYGGPQEGKQVNICESCHFNIHKTAESILSKNKKSKNWFNDLNLLKKASPFIQAIIEAKRNYEEGNTNRNIPRRKMIILKLSDNEWKKLHKVKKDKGFSNMNTFLESILRSLIKI